MGRHYKFSLTYLTTNRSTIINTLAESQKMKEKNLLVSTDRQFFCSELVAKVYKICGLTKPSDISCSSYLPSNFASKHFTIPFMGGIMISPEKAIVSHILE